MTVPATFTGVARFDRGLIRGKTERTKEGYLRTDAAVTRTGVFTYVKIDGSTRRELRHPSDVFTADSLSSLRLKPVTNEHPPTRLLDASSAKQFQIGYTGENVRTADSRFVMAPLVIVDSDAIKAVDGGKQELSCGYSCDLIQEDGEYEGEKYDHRQTNIQYNHVAVVDKGRAGSDVRIKMDSMQGEDAYSLDAIDLPIKPVDNKDNHSSQRSRPMNKITLDGIEYEASPEVINAYRKLEKAVTDNQAKIDSLTAETEKIKADRDTHKAKLDEIAKIDNVKIVADAVKARLALERAVAGILPQDTKIDSMSDKDIRVAVVKARFPEANLDAASDEYIRARFDATMELVKADAANADTMAKQRQASGSRTPAENTDCGDADAARKWYMDRLTGKKDEAKK